MLERIQRFDIILGHRTGQNGRKIHVESEECVLNEVLRFVSNILAAWETWLSDISGHCRV